MPGIYRMSCLLSSVCLEIRNGHGCCILRPEHANPGQTTRALPRSPSTVSRLAGIPATITLMRLQVSNL